MVVVAALAAGLHRHNCLDMADTNSVDRRPVSQLERVEEPLGRLVQPDCNRADPDLYVPDVAMIKVTVEVEQESATVLALASMAMASKQWLLAEAAARCSVLDKNVAVAGVVPLLMALADDR